MGRLNTFRISYGSLPNKPTLNKVQKFCLNELALKQGEVIRFQNSRALGVTFVTVIDLDLAKKVCEEHDKVHDMVGSDGKKYPLSLTLEDGAVEVKIYDLSADVPNADVISFLGKYGDVRSIYEEQLGDDQDFPGAYTGIRIAKMVVAENIDSWVTINGEMTQVTYFGQRQTCRHCREYLHIGATCVQNKKLLVQKTYADAAKQPAKPKNSNKTQKKSVQEQPTKDPRPRSQSLPKDEIKSTTQGNEELPHDSPNLSTVTFLKPPTTGWKQISRTGMTNTQNPVHTSGTINRKSVADRNEGNDTDSSVASSTSSKRSLRGRPPGKKLKGGYNERE